MSLPAGSHAPAQTETPAVRLVALADLHGNLPLDLPDGDVLALVGDLFPTTDHSITGQAAWLKKHLAPYLRSLPFESILVAGNHDFLFAQPENEWRRLLPDNAHYLCDQTLHLHGLLFHGTPYTPRFGNWAFMLDEDGLAEKWALIPSTTDVLLSHGPPYGTSCDLTAGRPPVNAGSRTLRYWIEQAQPRLVVCGHIHEGHGRSQIGTTTVANVSLVDEHCRPVHQAQTFVLYPHAGMR